MEEPGMSCSGVLLQSPDLKRPHPAPREIRGEVTLLGACEVSRLPPLE